MDAKAMKFNVFGRRQDENDVAQSTLPGKTLHQRNKSMSALNSTMHTKGLAVNPIRRGAFADVSNTRNILPSNNPSNGKTNTLLDVKPIRPAHKDAAQAPLAPLNTQPLQSIDINASKPKTLLRPAQRALSTAHKALPAAPLNTNVVAASSSTAVDTGAGPIRKTIVKRHTTIFRDTSIGSTAPLPSSVEAKPISTSASLPQKSAITEVSKLVSSQTTSNTLSTVAIQKPVVPIEPALLSLPASKPSVLPPTVLPTIEPTPTVEPLLPLSRHLPELEPLHVLPAIENIDERNVEPELYLPALETQLPPLEPVLLEEKAIQPQVLTELEEYWEEEEQEQEFFDAEGCVTARSLKSMGGDNTTGAMSVVLMPRITARVERELAAAKAWVDENGLAETTEDEAWDTTMVAEYSEEIFSYMRELENKMMPNPYYMDNQAEIQWSMRSVLIDWVIQVHARFGLLPETLFLAVNCIDRFLSVKVVSLAKLQLVGATAIYVAAKYEEINCPSVQEIAYMVDGSYTIEEILKAERFMLTMLKFELGWPGPMSFLRRISKADDYDVETRTLAKYFLEVTLMDERFVGCVPSFLAAGSHCLARLMLGKGDWGAAHAHFSQYTYSQLRHLMTVILGCCDNPRSHHAAVYDKYTAKNYKKASTFVEHEISRGFELPQITRESIGNHAPSWRRKSQISSAVDKWYPNELPVISGA